MGQREPIDLPGLTSLLGRVTQSLESTEELASDLRDASAQALEALRDVIDGNSSHDEAIEGLQASAEVFHAGEERADSLQRQARRPLDQLASQTEQLWAEIDGLQARSQIGEKIIQAQEEERHRLAREIHDGPAQALANIVLRAEICEKLYAAGREELTQELAQLKLLVRASLQEVRRIIFDLRPMTLDDLGLVPTLRRYFANMRDYEGTPIELHVVGIEERLSSAVEVAAFRTIQEAVNNARRHAQSSRIAVTLRFEADELVVVVADDGIGFDVDEVWRELKNRPSFGLLGMKERMELLAGEFSIHSIADKGTTITLRMPHRDDQ